MRRRRTRYFSGDDVADMKNARGFGVSLDRIAAHYGATVDEIKSAVGDPQSEQKQQSDELDLWRADELREVL